MIDLFNATMSTIQRVSETANLVVGTLVEGHHQYQRAGWNATEWLLIVSETSGNSHFENESS